MATRTAPTLGDIEEARERIAEHARVTPIYRSETFSRLCGRDVQLKAENLQRTGSFKVRGAVNKLATLSEAERAHGVVAASAGNHGQAVAWAARELGAPATIFVPEDAPMTKVDAARHYGAEVRFVGSDIEESLTAAREYVEECGATFVHPFEDELVIAGQGTIGLELADQLDELDTVLVPIGGGGLCAGIGVALKSIKPGARIIGVQTAGTRPGGTGFTIADGIAVKHPGELTMSILEQVCDEFLLVTDEEISEAIVLLLERAKLVVEGAGAVGVAALLAGRVTRGSGPVAIVLSGGNIDPTLLITVMRHGLTQAGRYLVLRTRVPDRPGELAKLLALLGGARVNVLSVEHHREGMDIPIGETEVELTLVTRDSPHCDDVMETMRGWGYGVERVS
ncbi:MAG: threonine ammonia-lyase [Actinobacteria bacterium]|nr:MAG: threonine ammonia-lyase [Actinomycetota bacterium]